MSSDGMTNYWRLYNSSFVAAVVFAALYTLTCLVTVFQYVWYRSWFWYLVVVASIMESLGYVCRSISLSHKSWRDPYFIQYLMIFLAPAFLAAGCYMAMGRIMSAALPSYRGKATRAFIILPRFLTPVFVTCDVVAFFVQLTGAASTLNQHSDATVHRGIIIVRIGLALQVLCFGFFVLLTIRFHFVAKRYQQPEKLRTAFGASDGRRGEHVELAAGEQKTSSSRTVDETSAEVPGKERWRVFLYLVNTTSVLIFIRTVYRLVEFTSGGVTGYAGSHDWTFYCFEGGLILPCLVAFIVFHPGRYLDRAYLGFRFRPKNNIAAEG